MSVDRILEDREKQYGDPEYNLERIGKLWAVIIGHNIEPIPSYKVALMMDALKTVRILSNPFHQDSWDDKLGYTTIGIEIINGKRETL